MIPRRQRLVVKGFPKTAPLLGACSWLRAKTIPNQMGYNRYAVLFVGVKLTSTRRHFLKRRVLAATQNMGSGGQDLLFIISGPGPKTLSEFKKDINQTLNIKK